MHTTISTSTVTTDVHLPLHSCFTCPQPCHTHLIILPTHTRWLQVASEKERTICVIVSLLCQHGHTGSKHCGSADLDSSSVEPCSFSDHAFAWLKTHPCFAFDVLSRLFCCGVVSSLCHPCLSDAYATLAGIDYARDRPLEISI